MGEHGLSLDGVVPGIEPAGFVERVRACSRAHGQRLEHVPIGLEHNGDLVVVDNQTGAVLLEELFDSMWR